MSTQLMQLALRLSSIVLGRYQQIMDGRATTNNFTQLVSYLLIGRNSIVILSLLITNDYMPYLKKRRHKVFGQTLQLIQESSYCHYSTLLFWQAHRGRCYQS